MQAIQIDRYGGPEVIVRRELALPEPGPGEVRVRVGWSGVNFMDVHTRQGKYAGSRTYPQTLPTTLGIEGAGIVEAAGEGVLSPKVGERVAWCLVWGSYAEHAIVPAWRCAPVPDALPLRRAASALFHGLTAHYLAHDLGRLGPGVTCLVHAASGGIGQILVQLGRRLGATVLATTSTDAKAELARARGAHACFRYEDGGFADRVRAATGGRGADVVFDAIGAPTLRDSLRATRLRGLVVSYGSVGGPVRDLDPIELGEAGSLFLTRPRLADHLPDTETIRRRAGDIFAAMLDGSLAIEIGDVVEFDGVERAHAALEERRSVNKPLLRLGGDAPAVTR